MISFTRRLQEVTRWAMDDDGEMKTCEKGDWVRWMDLAAIINRAGTQKRMKEGDDPRVHMLINYYSQKFLEHEKFTPTIHYGAWTRVMKRHLMDSDAETIKAVIDAFFAYPKRQKVSIYDFDKRYDAVYGYLHKQQYR